MVITSFKSVIILVVVFTLVLKVSLERHLPRVKRSSCPSEDWSQWINNNKPSIGDGEYEQMDAMTRSSFCRLGRIHSAACVEVNFKAVVGVKYSCDSTNGLVCRKADNGPAGCPDMMIRYKCTIPCPPTAPSFIATTPQKSPTLPTSTKILTSDTPMTTSTSAASSPLTSVLLSASTTMVDSRTTASKPFSSTRTVSTTGFGVHSTSIITISNNTTSVESSTAVRTTRATEPSRLPTSTAVRTTRVMEPSHLPTSIAVRTTRVMEPSHLPTSIAVRTTRVKEPSHLPTTTVTLVTATSSTSTPSSSVLVSTRKVPLSTSTMRYTDIFISLTSTSFKSTLEMSQSEAGPVKAIGNVQEDTKALEIWPIHAAICGVLFLITFLLVIKICIMSRKEKKSEADMKDPAGMRPRKSSIQVHPHLDF